LFYVETTRVLTNTNLVVLCDFLENHRVKITNKINLGGAQLSLRSRDMKSKLNADMFRCLKFLFHLSIIQINFENGDKNGVLDPSYVE
jgi:hypothetical protein